MPGKPRPAVVRCMLWLGAVHTYSLGSPAPPRRRFGAADYPAAVSMVTGVMQSP